MHENETENLIRAAGELWLAGLRLDELVDDSAIWPMFPREVHAAYVEALRDLGAAYGSFRAAQYEQEHAR